MLYITFTTFKSSKVKKIFRFSKYERTKIRVTAEFYFERASLIF